MSKKLVKTAKQQFEERLRELNVVREWKMCDTEIYYLCEDSKAHVHLLRDQDGEYKELSYGQQYEALVFSSRFLCAMSERFVELDIDIKPLFDWYASADHDDEPFSLLYIFMCELEESHFTFEDLYEEIPDVRIITAKEQWEKDSQGAEVVQKLANGSTYKVAVTDGSITFFVYQDGGEYFREIYPSFDELRKDASFVTAYLSHVQGTHDTDMNAALAWLQGGEYTMSKVSLLDIYTVGKDFDHLCYHDKEVPAGVVKQDFKDEMGALRTKMVAHIEQLCEQGMTVNFEALCKNYTIAFVDGSFDYTENLEEFYLMKHTQEPYWRYIMRYSNGEYDGRLGLFTIETLHHIIEALQ